MFVVSLEFLFLCVHWGSNVFPLDQVSNTFLLFPFKWIEFNGKATTYFDESQNVTWLIKLNNYDNYDVKRCIEFSYESFLDKRGTFLTWFLRMKCSTWDIVHSIQNIQKRMDFNINKKERNKNSWSSKKNNITWSTVLDSDLVYISTEGLCFKGCSSSLCILLKWSK